VQNTTQRLGKALAQGQTDQALANSALYLDMMGKTIIAWLWLDMANKALQKFADSRHAEDQQFMAGKIQAAQYFMRWELPEIEHYAKLLNQFDDTCLSMQVDWF
jgi:butyryl-CoA dehydrogenase